ncbi:MAG: hypothetical protein ACFHWX_15005 [Bacteroidota bacterium]
MLLTDLQTDHTNNEYALTAEDKEIYITDAPSGRKGYYCLGCKKEMQAVRSKDPKRRSYFRHDPKFVDPNKKCTYSDETYRHKLAKEILDRIKSIKVPTVKKYPPKGVDGPPNILIEPKLVKAHEVLIERQFFESDDGEVYYGRNPATKFKHLLIKPDVAFLNEKGKPFLFIEIVATHKVSSEKYRKIKRLSIDTVQVRIPKDSPQEIERTFSITQNTRWVFNNEEQRAEYVPVSKSHPNGTPAPIELERELFEENYTCRATQIGNLVRSIERCLQSESYIEIEKRLRSEIQRVEGNTAKNRARNEKLRGGAKDRIYSEFEEKLRAVRIETESVEKEHKELEGRYYRKREELDESERKAQSDYEGTIESYGGAGKTLGERKREIKEEEARIQRDIEEALRAIERDQAYRASIPERFRIRTKQMEEEFQLRIRKTEEDTRKIQKEESELPAKFKQLEDEARLRFDRLQKEFAGAIERRDGSGDRKGFEDISKLLQRRQRINDYKNAQQLNKTKRAAWECFESKAWKSWEI